MPSSKFLARGAILFVTIHIVLILVLTSNSAVGALKPSRNNILHELEALRSRVRPGDTVFVAYSGHGVDRGLDWHQKRLGRAKS